MVALLQTNTEPQWRTLLARRGIGAVASWAGWKPNADGKGWIYPLFNMDGSESGHHRVKLFNSDADFKYFWPDGKGEIKYYILPDAREAIIATNSLIIASGEPDVLAWRAAGAKNVLSWFGEAAIPATLAGDLAELSVNRVELYPDRDQTGLDSAQSIVARLRGTPLDVRVYELPQPLGSKYDINKLWQDCQFNKDKFWEALEACAELHFEAINDPFPAGLNTEPDDPDKKHLPAAFIGAIEKALQVGSYYPTGWSKPIKCVFHDDQHASASWNHDKQIFKCQTCTGAEGDYKLAMDVAGKLGIHVQDYFEKKASSVTTSNAPRKTPAGKPQVVFSWAEATKSAIASVLGNTDIYEALPIFSKNIAYFGGLAELVQPGKMIAVLADSGHGKTSLLETQIDSWRRGGYHGVIWSPEWSKEELVFRAIQRMGGPSLTDIIRHNTYKGAAARGVDDKRNPGKLMTDEQLACFQLKAKEVETWPGALDIIDHAGLDVLALNNKIVESLDSHAAAGRRISFVCVDYLQLLDASGNSDHERTKAALNQLKALTVNRKLVTIAGSQITKSDGRGGANGGKINQHSGQNLRSDVFNLLISLKRNEDSDGNFESTAEVRVSKNSLGKNGTTTLFQKPNTNIWHDADMRPLNL